MKIEELMKCIVSSSTYRKEIGTSFQLGLPQFTIRNNELFVTFYPHVERYSDGNINYFTPQYELELVYPFRHIVLLKDLFFIRNGQLVSPNMPIWSNSIENIESNIEHLHELFSKANEIIHSRKSGAEELPRLVLEYEKCYEHFVESMGLKGIYGGNI